MLNHRLTIEQKATGTDAIGQPVESWETVAEVWGNVKYQNGLSAIKSDADVSIVKASIRIRHRTGLNAGMRVLFDDVVFDVKAVLPEETKRYIDLVCEVV